MSTKSAEAMRTTENDAQKELEELFEAPEGRPSAGGSEVPWGVTPRHPAPSGQLENKGSQEEFLKDTPSLLGHAFDGYEASRKGDQSFIHQHFSTSDFATRSPLLRKYAEKGNVPSDATLSERVRNLTGRR